MAVVRVEEVTKGLKILRVDDRETAYFEALWEIPEGVTYNAYLLETKEGAVLFDGWKSQYSQALIEALESLISPDDLRYIVVHHAEPDHAGSLPALLRWAPKARVLGHPLVGKMLAGTPGLNGRFEAVRDGGSLSLGGVELRFIHAPWLHWPETMMTWLPRDGVLLSCDAFGSFGAAPGVFDDECAGCPLEAWVRKYVATVIGRYRPSILRALGKLGSLGVEPRIIAPGHGVVWRSRPRWVMELYERLARAEPVEGKVLILYASMYGSTERLALALAGELARRGLKPVVHGFTDKRRPLIAEVIADALDAEALVVAAPTYEAGLYPYLRLVIELICEKAAAKRLYILSTYAWGGAAVKRIRGIMEGCGFETMAFIEAKSVLESQSPTDKIANIADEISKVPSTRQ